MKRTLIGVLVALAVSAAAVGQAPPPPKATVADLSWMAGRWVDDSGGGLSEEIWSEPSGDGMIGMWRMVREGKARVLEILVIRMGDEGPELRLRHFDPKLVAREDKETPIVLKLVAWKPREARFEGPAVGYEGNVVITYRRASDDTLKTTLERRGERLEFSFQRKPLTP